MRKELRFHPDIYQEIKEAYDWYELGSAGLGEDFLEELERAYSLIQRFPDMWPVMEKNIRRYLLKRFPYCVIKLKKISGSTRSGFE
ncbi:MAG TPA: type II toxin-antitoxin system RelE/ParE family toxin [Desulfobacterales bacterium]|nr:type II toxin-antitoxin system RelE/ParE family toxin [Desulfobacterales bacterium]